MAHRKLSRYGRTSERFHLLGGDICILKCWERISQAISTGKTNITSITCVCAQHIRANVIPHSLTVDLLLFLDSSWITEMGWYTGMRARDSTDDCKKNVESCVQFHVEKSNYEGE